VQLAGDRLRSGGFCVIVAFWVVFRAMRLRLSSRASDVLREQGNTHLIFSDELLWAERSPSGAHSLTVCPQSSPD
jgi:hypothetical protein